MSTHVWDNQVLPASSTTTNWGGSAITFGARFTTSSTRTVYNLLFYKGTTNRVPTKLTLWSDSGTLLETINVSTIMDSGWNSYALATPRVLAAGTYRVAAFMVASGDWSFVNVAGLSNPPTGISWAATPRCYTTAGDAFPTTTDALSGPWLVDVALDATDTAPPIPPGVSTGSDVANALSDWLSDNENTHTAHSIPYLDHATIGTINTNVSDVKTQENDWAFGLGAAAHGYFADVKGLINNIKTVTDTLPTPIAQLTSIVLDHYTADIDNILAQMDSVLAGLSAQSTTLAGTGGSAVGALSGRSAFPATGWSMSAEESFADSIAFNEPADAYVVSITSYQPTQPATATAAGLWLYRVGWWCVLNGSLASERAYVEFEQQLLTDQGRRMPACAIQLKPGTMATVQAWLLA